MDFVLQTLNRLKEEGLYRTLRQVESEQGKKILIDGQAVLLFSSNNYLGLAAHPLLKEAAIEATTKYGCGSGASRLISGNSFLYKQLEDKISRFIGMESALVYSSGYMANIGVISALCLRGDIIFSDRLNHASIVDACIMSRAMVKRYPHKNLTALEEMLKKGSRYKKKLIVTDALFSMDGDIAPIPDLLALAHRYGATLMIDEAHAIGTLGKTGRGIIEYYNLSCKDSLICMGTFGKAFGSFGSYIAGSKKLIDFLINRSRNLIFTTALPPSVLAASIAALDIVEKTPTLVTTLQKNSAYLRAGLKASGLTTLQSTTHIIPILINDPKETMEISKKLFTHGLFIQGIRPPSVPKGSSRLRITIMSSHTPADLDFALETITRILH